MNQWFEEQLHLLLTCEDYGAFVSGLSKAVHDLDFDYFAYGMRVSISITQPQFKLENNYPAMWQQRYESKNYLEHDPTVRYGLTSSIPFLWSDTLFKGVQHFWEDAKSHGLHWGWAQSTRLNRCTTGMLTLSRSDCALSRSELSEKTPLMLWLNQFSQAQFYRFWLDEILPRPAKPLSRREIEVIKWCAEGKTSSEIADILHVSERTVSFHTANAIEKLNVTNKTAAAIRAFQLEII